jgi:hypothetical protein
MPHCCVSTGMEPDRITLSASIFHLMDYLAYPSNVRKTDVGQCLSRCTTQGRSVTVTNRRQPNPRLIRPGVKFGDGRRGRRLR